MCDFAKVYLTTHKKEERFFLHSLILFDSFIVKHYCNNQFSEGTIFPINLFLLFRWMTSISVKCDMYLHTPSMSLKRFHNYDRLAPFINKVFIRCQNIHPEILTSQQLKYFLEGFPNLRELALLHCHVICSLFATDFDGNLLRSLRVLRLFNCDNESVTLKFIKFLRIHCCNLRDLSIVYSNSSSISPPPCVEDDEGEELLELLRNNVHLEHVKLNYYGSKRTVDNESFCNLILYNMSDTYRHECINTIHISLGKKVFIDTKSIVSIILDCKALQSLVVQIGGESVSGDDDAYFHVAFCNKSALPKSITLYSAYQGIFGTDCGCDQMFRLFKNCFNFVTIQLSHVPCPKALLSLITKMNGSSLNEFSFYHEVDPENYDGLIDEMFVDFYSDCKGLHTKGGKLIVNAKKKWCKRKR